MSFICSKFHIFILKFFFCFLIFVTARKIFILEHFIAFYGEQHLLNIFVLETSYTACILFISSCSVAFIRSTSVCYNFLFDSHSRYVCGITGFTNYIWFYKAHWLFNLQLFKSNIVKACKTGNRKYSYTFEHSLSQLLLNALILLPSSISKRINSEK